MSLVLSHCKNVLALFPIGTNVYYKSRQVLQIGLILITNQGKLIQIGSSVMFYQN